VAVKLQRQREVGLSLRDSRRRKARAKEVAFQRLSSNKDNRHGEDEIDEATKPMAEPATKAKKSKHAPKEVSSKRSEFFKRLRRSDVNGSGLGVTLAAGFKPRDPRQSPLSGHLDAEKFERNYAFLNELRDKEIIRLRQRIQAHQTTGSRGRHLRRRLGISQNATATLDDDRAELKRLELERKEMERQQIDRAAKRAVKKRMHDQGERGQQPRFVSRAKQKQMVLEAKYDEIRKRKGDRAVEKTIAKRLKKDKSKMMLPKERL
jgi:ribosomal RNA-processing protein 36